MSHPIHPAPYIPTDQEHQIAWLKQCLSRVVWDGLLPVNMARRGDFKNHPSVDNDEYGKECLNNLLDELFTRDEADNKEPWERLLPFEDFKKTWGIEGLAEPHCGDCVCVSCPCTRCWAESYYDVPRTATWYKHDGGKLYSEWKQLKENK
jgi:hypothetical protein